MYHSIKVMYKRIYYFLYRTLTDPIGHHKLHITFSLFSLIALVIPFFMFNTSAEAEHGRMLFNMKLIGILLMTAMLFKTYWMNRVKGYFFLIFKLSAVYVLIVIPFFMNFLYRFCY